MRCLRYKICLACKSNDITLLIIATDTIESGSKILVRTKSIAYLPKNTGLFRLSHFCAPQINTAVSCDLTRGGGEAL